MSGIRTVDDLWDAMTEEAKAVTDRVGGGNYTLDDMADHFADPGEMFVVSPVPISLSELARLYLPRYSVDRRAGLLTELRRRARDERWVESRAVFQTRRLSARQEAFLALEGQVWAVVGIEFQQRRLRSLMERWELLDEAVTRDLRLVADGETKFSMDMRDQCRELASIESQLAALVPLTDAAERGGRFWHKSATDRKALLEQIEERTRVAAGADRAQLVFEVIDGGVDDPSSSSEDE